MENNLSPENNTFLNHTLKIPPNFINQFQPSYSFQNIPAQTNINVNIVNNNTNNTNNNNNLFKCKYCTKTYLSNTALRNHMFHKHKPNIKKMKAGRPRLYVDDNYDIVNYNYARNKYAKFWYMLKRKFSGTINMEKVLKAVFDDLYVKYGNLLHNGNKIKTWREHPWLKILISNDDINNNDSYKISCDTALKNYVYSVKEKTNENYFTFIIKFLVLFRECFNSSKNLIIKTPIANNVERSTIISADQMPEISNEFFTDYLTKKNFFDYSITLNDLTEMTELIQHLCYFLHLKDYTSLRLVLINKDNEK